MAENVFFPVFYDSKELTDLLDDSQYRKLFEALYDYAISGKELVSDDRLLTMAYLSMRSQIRRVYDQAEAKASAARSRWKKGHDDPEHDDPADAEKKCMSTKNVHMQNDGADAENSCTQSNPIQSNKSNPINPIKEREASGKPSASRPARKAYGSYKNVLLSDSDHDKFMAERPKDADQLIEAMSCYLKSKGKAYKDYLAALRSWARREDERRPRTISLHPEEDRDPYGSGRDIHALDDTLVAVMEGRA